eukprot:175634-Rhodomonas_salina.2
MSDDRIGRREQAHLYLKKIEHEKRKIAEVDAGQLRYLPTHVLCNVPHCTAMRSAYTCATQRPVLP